MQFQDFKITIRNLTEEYKNNDEEGVTGLNGKLNIRPQYQREFIYKDKQRDMVIDTIVKGFPLGIFTWADNNNGTFEVLDGQQRTISICEYVRGTYHIKDNNGNEQYFHNLDQIEKDQILNYELKIETCKGSSKEKLEWFQRINIAGVELTEQELRNATYTGPWLTDAKRYFSKTNCAAYSIANSYVKGSPIRQDYLETAIEWISNENITKYMADNQHSSNANELWLYFKGAIDWVSVIFPNYRKEMKGVNWGILYNKLKNNHYDSQELEKEITKLMQDEDVTKKSGIYSYILTREEKYLSIRSFTDNQKRETFERQNGRCIKCDGSFDIKEMEADHITPWHEGGKTISDNCQMLCKHCNRIKSGK